MWPSRCCGCKSKIGFEVLSVDPTGGWSILSGDCRFTPDGMKAPLWSQPASLGDAEDHRVTGLEHGAGGIYLLTGKGHIHCLGGADRCEEIAPERAGLQPDALVKHKGRPMLIWSAGDRVWFQELP